MDNKVDNIVGAIEIEKGMFTFITYLIKFS